jgi:hypothetical protein
VGEKRMDEKPVIHLQKQTVSPAMRKWLFSIAPMMD